MEGNQRKVSCSGDGQSKLDLIDQLKVKFKTALDQDMHITYIMILDNDDREKAADAIAEAVEQFDDECRPRTTNEALPEEEEEEEEEEKKKKKAFMPKEKRYIFIEPKEISRGGYGAVYKARLEGSQVQNDRLCIKTGIHKQEYSNPEEKRIGQIHVNKSIIREADTFKLLNANPNDHIIKFHFNCASTTDNEVMIGLEHFAGEDLSKFIHDCQKRDEAIPTKHVHTIMRKSTAAVDHLQSLGLCHCDIKPHNILYNCINEELKFIDFGSAINISEGDLDLDLSEEEICVAGTPEYMAPEILVNGVSSIDKQSDIYSLGTLFYRMITLQKPWHFIKEIREQREKHNNHKVWDLVKAQHRKYCIERPNIPETETQGCFTKLQEKVVDDVEGYYRKNSKECQLIKDMLSFTPAKRPSCSQIISRVGECDKLTRQISELSFGSSGSFSEMPSSASSDTSNNPIFLQIMDSGPSAGSSSMNPAISEKHRSLIEESPVFPTIPETPPRGTSTGVDTQSNSTDDDAHVHASPLTNQGQPQNPDDEQNIDMYNEL